MKDFIKRFDKKGDPVRAIVGLTAFLGANTAVLSIGGAFIPGRYGLLKRLVYMYGVGCLGLALSSLADVEARAVYDTLKNYKSHNETDDSTTSNEKEVQGNEKKGNEEN